MSRRGLFGLALLMLMLILADGWRRSGTVSGDAARPSPIQPDSAITGASDSGANPAAQIMSDAAAPLPSAPAEQSAIDPMTPAAALDAAQYEQLAQRARRGDVQAARRLHQQLRLCEVLSSVRLDVAQIRIALRRPDAASHPYRRQMDQMLKAEAAQLCLQQRHCAELDQIGDADATEWLLSAAMAGDTDAQTEFATGWFLQQTRLSSQRWLVSYRQHAVRFLEAAMANGHPEAFLQAAIAYRIRDDDPGQTPLSQLLGHDPLRARSYLVALARATYPTAERHLSHLDQQQALAPEQRARSERLANALHLRHFLGRDLDADASRYAQLGLHTGSTNPHLLEQGQRCLAVGR